MIMSRMPQIGRTLPGEDEIKMMPVSARSVLVEERIAGEMSATLQGWMRGLSTRSARYRKYKSRT